MALRVGAPQRLARPRFDNALHDEAGVRQRFGQSRQRSPIVPHVFSEPTPFFLDDLLNQITGFQKAFLIMRWVVRRKHDAPIGAKEARPLSKRTGDIRHVMKHQ